MAPVRRADGGPTRIRAPVWSSLGEDCLRDLAECAARPPSHGGVHLREFSVDGVIKPVPKRKGLGGLSTPFQIYGPIMHPEIESDRLRLAAETGKLLALGFLNPALMIVPFVDLGTDGNPCEGALASRLRE